MGFGWNPVSFDQILDSSEVGSECRGFGIGEAPVEHFLFELGDILLLDRAVRSNDQVEFLIGAVDSTAEPLDRADHVDVPALELTIVAMPEDTDLPRLAEAGDRELSVTGPALSAP